MTNHINGSSRDGAWKNGSVTSDNTLVNTTKQGDEVKLIPDCDAAKLSLHLTSSRQFHIDTPSDKTWRLNADMFYPSDKIRIINE